MICSKCGHQFPREDTQMFCPECGVLLTRKYGGQTVRQEREAPPPQVNSDSWGAREWAAIVAVFFLFGALGFWLAFGGHMPQSLVPAAMQEIARSGALTIIQI